VWVRHKADFYEARATTLEGQERAVAFGKMKDAMGFFAVYEQKTDRVMPVIRLSRREHSTD
jgi:hypothetical protein